GEYAALYAAGVVSPTDIIYLVDRRAVLVLERREADTLPMLLVNMSATELQAFIDAHPQYSTCGISCINRPSATVVSGCADEI
ncbi:hypothetical protein LY76DRAFT_495835, partial [Colletotrichum caudatum]